VLHRLLLIAALVATPALARERADEPVRDDPRARAAARLWYYGERTAEEGFHILNAAQAERSRPRALSTALARVPSAAWVNLGPTNAAFQKNGSTYTKVDSGRIRRVLVHPTDPNIVYAATSGGGVWKTFEALAPTDAFSPGPKWFPITESIGSLSIGQMAMDPLNPNVLLLGLGDPFDVHYPGLLHSDDAGATWSQPVALSGTYPGASGPLTATSVRDLMIDPTGIGIVLAATDVGLFRSTEGGIGANWALVDLDPGHDEQDCWSAGWVGAGTWVVACIGSSGGTLWRTTDHGLSWTSVFSGIPAASRTDIGRMTVATARSDSGNVGTARVYVLAGNRNGDATKDVFRSANGGLTYVSLGVNSSKQATNWTNVDQPDLDVLHEQAWYNQMIAVDPRDHNRVLVGGNLCLIRTLDGGATWQVMADWLPFTRPDDPGLNGMAYVHADWHAGAFTSAGGGFAFYAGTDGGVFRSSDIFTAAAGKATFEDRLNRGIATHLLYTIVADERDPGNTIVLGGLQDNGTRLRSPQSSTPTVFNQIWGGDGIGVGIGKFGTTGKMGSLMIVTTPYELNRSQDTGQNFAPMMNGLPDTFQGNNFYMKLVTDFGDANGKTFLTLVNTGATARVFRWVDNGSAGNSWSDISSVRLRSGGTSSTYEQLRNLAADTLHQGRYGAVAYDKAYVKAAGSSEWNESVSVGASRLSSIAFDPVNTNTYWVSSLNGLDSQRISVTTDGGASWSARVGNLPEVPVNVVKVDPNDPQTVYAGTEIGLYRTTDGGTTWARYGTGLPLVSVSDMSITIDSSTLRVSTYGRGFWEITNAVANPTGVYGNGDMDRNQLLDGFDLVLLAAQLGRGANDESYDATANLAGTTNSVGDEDITTLVARIGGRP